MTSGRTEPDRPGGKNLGEFGYAFPETAASAAALTGAVPGRPDRWAVRIDPAKAATGRYPLIEAGESPLRLGRGFADRLDRPPVGILMAREPK